VNTPCDHVIYSLEIHPSRLNKEQIIQFQAEQGNDEFFEGCRLAFDPMITFGLKQIPEKTDEDGLGVSWNAFKTLVDLLSTRKLTGNAARDMVQDVMETSTKAQWNDWYRRILIKDLRCGISEKTVNKVVEKKFSHYTIPIFGCQLAHDSANHEGKVSGKKLIEVKLDGVRVITIVRPGGRVEMFSRNGKELLNFPHIADQIREVFKLTPFSDSSIVLDGEVMSSSFQDLMKQVHRKDNVKASDAVLHLFDTLNLFDFENGFSNEPQYKRSENLKFWIEKFQNMLPNVTNVANELVDLNTEVGQKRFREINQMAISGGYEGIMIKDPDAPYECKRSVAWLKLKPFIEVSLTIVGVEEGTGKNAGKLGAMIVEGTDSGKFIQTNVGSGLTDLQRDSFWTARNSLPGKVVEVRADAITQNQDGSYSLRFPRFLRFRGFEQGEKL
jgi:DNA ligase-1